MGAFHGHKTPRTLSHQSFFCFIQFRILISFCSIVTIETKWVNNDWISECYCSFIHVPADGELVQIIKSGLAGVKWIQTGYCEYCKEPVFWCAWIRLRYYKNINPTLLKQTSPYRLTARRYSSGEEKSIWHNVSYEWKYDSIFLCKCKREISYLIPYIKRRSAAPNHSIVWLEATLISPFQFK